MFVFYILIIWFFPNISNNFYNGTGGDQIYAQHKRRTGEDWLGAHGVISCSIYGLKRGIPWHLFAYLYFITTMSSEWFKQNLSWHSKRQLTAEHIRGLVSITLCQLMEQLRLKIGIPWKCLFSLYYYYYVFLMFQTSYIIAQENINYLHNTK